MFRRERRCCSLCSTTAAAALVAVFSLFSLSLCQCHETRKAPVGDTSDTIRIDRKLYYRDNNDYTYPYDLSAFSVKYEKCQNVQSWSDELADDEESSGTVFAIKEFVVFRLCPSDSCETCNANYGEYVLPADEYLLAATERTREDFENFCKICEETCNNGGYCDECSADCSTYDNLGNNGYVDASNYVQCQQIEMNNNDNGEEGDENNDGQNGNDAEGQLLYIGPRCSSNGSRIYIGLFSDEDCGVPYELPDGQTMADYIGAKLWYRTLENAYAGDAGDCMSCAENNDDANGDENNQNDRNDADNVNQMCEEVYSASAKCESKHGITAGFIQTNREEQDYEKKVENEFLVCNFIESLILDSYTEMGEINIYEEQDVVIRQTTTLQKATLSILSLSIFGILSYSVWLSRAIDVAFPSMDLFACAGEGTMA